eukprot:CAMPEP_0205949950 /NCGR_PEP_ID=MMETSP1459-20131121/1966_1 /ASSEMBLY_ACC=CAM_ASM_001120 /TAXON_ID=41880 /ORGANISM="Pycnococcus provasolii, Strain RCC931" /LENGTH=431 /DNA_ID=CAMNT_0053321565 /DNA_START=69 /DNA_END=1365 /DNA_ORIENTATION=-
MVIDYSRFDAIDTTTSSDDNNNNNNDDDDDEEEEEETDFADFAGAERRRERNRASGVWSQRKQLPPPVEEMPMHHPPSPPPPPLVVDSELAARVFSTAFLPWWRVSHDDRVAATIRRYQHFNGGPNRFRVSCGSSHALVIGNDGSVQCFGDNKKGKAPREGIPGSFLAVAAGNNHSILLQYNGSVVGLGSNDHGQAPSLLPGPYVAIAAGLHNTVLLRLDGTAEFYGVQGFPNPQLAAVGWQFGEDPAWLTQAGPFVGIASAGSHTVAIRTDGSLVGWGDNQEGQAPVHVRGPFKFVAAGLGTTLAINEHGRLVAFGMLAPENPNHHSVGEVDELLADEGPFIAVTSSILKTIALRADGTIMQSKRGSSMHGLQISDSEEETFDGRFIAVDYSELKGFTVALRADGEVVTFDLDDYLNDGGDDEDGGRDGL